ncbi:hypothetical protein V7S43_013546 [Phytophthora oleae]|uniref:Uncharacterized protein n=1 Tax=Phytophthora oleae TaxID=2107226 RepID=A0ABD3F5R8_9STRA
MATVATPASAVSVNSTLPAPLDPALESSPTSLPPLPDPLSDSEPSMLENSVSLSSEPPEPVGAISPEDSVEVELVPFVGPEPVEGAAVVTDGVLVGEPVDEPVVEPVVTPPVEPPLVGGAVVEAVEPVCPVTPWVAMAAAMRMTVKNFILRGTAAL